MLFFNRIVLCWLHFGRTLYQLLFWPNEDISDLLNFFSQMLCHSVLIRCSVICVNGNNWGKKKIWNILCQQKSLFITILIPFKVFFFCVANEAINVIRSNYLAHIDKSDWKSERNGNGNGRERESVNFEREEGGVVVKRKTNRVWSVKVWEGGREILYNIVGQMLTLTSTCIDILLYSLAKFLCINVYRYVCASHIHLYMCMRL